MNAERVQNVARSLRWLPAYAWQRMASVSRRIAPTHLIIAVADHFEPAFVPGISGPGRSVEEQLDRLDRWCQTYPVLADRFRDDDGRPFRHTYFYPAEQAEPRILERLAAHCHDGWGEVEIHLHHGVEHPDTAANTRRVLVDFRDQLAALGCLSRWQGDGSARYAFVHGNWALANSAGNRFCGVDDEMSILMETGCYADFTLPSAPHPAQIAKINSVYEIAAPLSSRAPHRKGRNLERGSPPTTWPIVVQGPLGVRVERQPGAWPRPRLENGEMTTANPPSMKRLETWCRVPITVGRRPEWMFIKLHCHSMDPRDTDAMVGEATATFLRDLKDYAARSGAKVLFVTAREMINILLAACDGREGPPGQFRDYRLVPLRSRRCATEMRTQ